MSDMISTIEITLLILLPLILFYQRNKLGFKKYSLYIVLLYLLWISTYAFLHETCHLFGSWITGTIINDYQLIPAFLEGDFQTAYVNSQFENNTQAFVSGIMPYLRDIVCLIIGFLILRKNYLKNKLLTGLILVLLILSPLYDIVNNYSGFIFESYGDFYMLSLRFGNYVVHTIGITFVLISILFTIQIFKIYWKSSIILIEN